MGWDSALDATTTRRMKYPPQKSNESERMEQQASLNFQDRGPGFGLFEF